MNIVRKLYDSTIYSLMGLVHTFQNELAFKIEIVTLVIITPIAIYIAKDYNQLLWLIFSSYLVLVVELGNTAIEATVDRIGIERNELSKQAKDAGSAAVLCTLILAAFVWLRIISHNYISFF